MGETRVLVVDDEEAIRRNFRVFLEDMGYGATEAVDGAQALEVLARERIDIVLTDLRMDGMGGRELVEALARMYPEIPVVVVSGTGNTRDAIEAIRHGAWDYMMKPVLDAGQLDIIIRKALDRARLMEENRRHREHLEELIAEGTAALRESEQRYRRITEALTDYIITTRIEGGEEVEKRHGPGCFGVTGYTQEQFIADPRLWLSIIEESDRAAVEEQHRRAMERGSSESSEHRFHRKDGSVRWVRHTTVPKHDSRGAVLQLDCLIQDITEHRMAEEEKARLQVRLAQAQKMESLGQLAGGVAHDFNNILTTILGFAELAMEDLAETDPKREQLGQIQLSAERAADLTRQLLAFARKQVIEPTMIDLSELIAGMEKMFRRLIREDVRLELVLTRPLGMIRADRGQMEQILINLLVNARDAMPDGGLIRVETAHAARDEEMALRHPKMASGDHVLLTVSDTGCGMAPEVQARLFEPFFTTKPQGKGTGLGAAIVFGAVQQNGGEIEFHSEPGVGTIFRIFLPQMTAESALPHRGGSAEAMPGGGETILFAEDDAALRDFTVTVLRRLGYRVLPCADGSEALRVAADFAETIHLLITDVVMPGMKGQALASSLAASRPGLPCLLVSGYAGDSEVGNRPERGIFSLGKPFTATSLARKVREAIGESSLPSIP